MPHAAFTRCSKTKSCPCPYEARDEDVPTKWMERVKRCLRYVSAKYNCYSGMIDDYHWQLYAQPIAPGKPWRENYAARQHAVCKRQVKTTLAA